ncbi:unnamed protein product [Kuraishia capsulata CBS 1993]|uniref:Amidase domain-containing protein n=1 Tax=Kuraishia capsulata CBS 1993 TaxID=1382522 RepID=W6MKJ7_9ASCO|nr:uncharacterized protein KUCA_T00001214001 [Kuraishia capsulata CBS 1993]CDK25247.1 unnamed protein product [Kuraishia capsulata CBS 1993]
MMVPFDVEDWQKKAAERRGLLTYPREWVLPAIYLEDIGQNSTRSVIDVPAECGILTSHELEITETRATPLLTKLRSGEWKSEDVTLAFCKRAVIAHQLTNCLTSLFLEEALKRARELDRILQETGKPVGPFHGLPISLKEIFNVNGADTTFGFVSWVGNYKDEDGLTVKLLKERGAVPFVKTNIAQGCLIVEGLNNLFGTTKNPHNLSLTPAGSSSGEGALIAMRGSPLGVGTDGGGSIRLPAHSNGVYGFMPSTHRVSSGGIAEGKGGLTWVRGQIGPLSTDVDSLETWIKAMIGSKIADQDFCCSPLEWREPQLSESLTIGVIYQDNVVETTSSMIRPLKNTCERLRELGHKIVEIDIGNLHREITETVFRFYVADGQEGYQKSIAASGEPYISRCCGSECERPMTISEVHEMDRKARLFSKKYLEIFVENGLDAILTPSSPTPAAPHGMYSTNSLSAVYNLLGYAAGIIPIGKIDLVKDAPTKEYLRKEPFADLNVFPVFPYDKYDSYVRKELYAEIGKFKNAPTSIQVVGRKFTDEKVLRIMKVIDVAING